MSRLLYGRIHDAKFNFCISHSVALNTVVRESDRAISSLPLISDILIIIIVLANSHNQRDDFCFLVEFLPVRSNEISSTDGQET